MTGTFNMGNSKLKGLDKFLPPGGANFDIIAVGLQESTYGMAVNINNPTEVLTNTECVEETLNAMKMLLGTNFYLVSLPLIILNFLPVTCVQTKPVDHSFIPQNKSFFLFLNCLVCFNLPLLNPNTMSLVFILILFSYERLEMTIISTPSSTLKII
jgi:hypothetical protein